MTFILTIYYYKKKLSYHTNFYNFPPLNELINYDSHYESS